MAFDPVLFRHTMRLWATGVTIVTTRHGDLMRGMTVSSFTSVTLEPPLVLVCLQKQTETAQAVLESGIFAVSMLGEDQQDVSNLFAGYMPLPAEADRFDQVEVEYAQTGAPIIAGSMGWVDCRIREVNDGSTHHIVIGEVVAASGQPEPATIPLIYYNRDYHRLV